MTAVLINPSLPIEGGSKQYCTGQMPVEAAVTARRGSGQEMLRSPHGSQILSLPETHGLPVMQLSLGYRM
jgi:hypothetical protein